MGDQRTPTAAESKEEVPPLETMDDVRKAIRRLSKEKNWHVNETARVFDNYNQRLQKLEEQRRTAPEEPVTEHSAFLEMIERQIEEVDKARVGLESNIATARTLIEESGREPDPVSRLALLIGDGQADQWALFRRMLRLERALLLSGLLPPPDQQGEVK